MSRPRQSRPGSGIVAFGRRGLGVVGGTLTSLPGRLVVTLGLLALVARSIDWGTVGDALSTAAWGWFALAVAAIAAAFAVAALRWQPLLSVARLPADLSATLRAYFVGAFTNNLLPTGFGGDAVRAWMVAGTGRPLARALTSVGVDRLSALGCLVLVGWIGVVIDPGAVPGKLIGLLAIASAGAIAGLCLAIVLLRQRHLGAMLPERLRPWASEVATVLRAYGADRGLIARVLLLGVGFQAMTVAALWLLAETIDLDVAVAVLAVVMPLVLIATVAPISVAGFGVREGAFVVLLGEVGIASGPATLLSLLSVAAMAIASLPGGVALLLRHERPEVPPEAYEPS